MNPITGVGRKLHEPAQAERNVWLALILTCGTCLSLFFACVTPFAALATLAALKLGRREKFVVVGLAWLANQTVGYGLLGYPRNLNSFAWGVAIGASAAAAIVAARALAPTRSTRLAVSLPFVAAFTAFELGLYVAGYVLPGSDGAFTVSVIWHVFLINAVSICVLMAMYQLAMMRGLRTRFNLPDPDPIWAVTTPHSSLAISTADSKRPQVG